ncbi:MAG TPA: DUF2911 domain-containing protein [Chitinophagaceae bacterium]|nr:DUF2911 domain-containing protein [Chitinophagaceae bacterium]
MCKTSILLCFLISFSFSFSQSAKLPEVDKSPMDVSYYPNNYPILKIQNKATEPLIARVLYSRPQKQGRKIFGELVEYDKVWRLGANEATEIEFYKDVKLGGKKVPKGRYTLYAIVSENVWTMILNKDTDTWGAFKYDSKKDMLRTDVAVQKTDEVVESMSMYFEKSTTGISLIVAWEQVKVTLPITL